MAKINRTDRLFVTILHGGSNLYSAEMSGLSTIGEVYRQVKSQTCIESGMVTLKLRNSTQGWTQQHNLVLKHKNESGKAGTFSNSIPAYPSLFDSII